MMQPPGGTAVFVCSAAFFHDLPEGRGAEYALVGRSNAGKSSFVNHACSSRGLARVAKRPGTTATANVYRLTGAISWVDLPGYGYAQAGRKEQGRWSSLAEEYCVRRENLAGILWFIDIRNIGVAADAHAYDWLRLLGKPLLAVLTKADKLSGSRRREQVRECMRMFPAAGEPVVYSTLEHESRRRFWDRFMAGAMDFAL